MTTHPPRRKLNEKEIGSLYMTSEVPLVIDPILKTRQCDDTHITRIHAVMKDQAPDMALIGVGLSGNMIGEALHNAEDETLQALGTELKYLSVNTVEEVGRIWIDAYHYNAADQQDIDDITHETADILCMFTSIFMELAEACTPDPHYMRAVASCLMYQCEAHADHARRLIDTPKQKISTLQAVPLPAALQDKTYQDNVVMFSLFQDHGG